MNEGVPNVAEMSYGTTVRERIEQGMREVGILLITFGPLDVALAHGDRTATRYLLFFLALGLALFVTAIVAEQRRSHGR